MNPVTASRRHFEDLTVGEVIALGEVTVTRDMIIDFAKRFDPLPFHLDEAAAKRSLLGGLAASGWQTAGLALRMLVDRFLTHIAAAGGLGFTDLKWKAPVLKNDVITGTATIAELRHSRTHPQWGIVTIDIEVQRKSGTPVMSMRLANLVDIRSPSAAGGADDTVV